MKKSNLERTTMIKRYDVLDSFRGLAAIGVLMYHIHTVDGISKLDFFRGANLFVEFFFILSGFVMYHAYCSKRVTFGQFVSSRFRRIYPLHLFTLCILLIFESLKLAASFKGFNFNIEPFTGRNSTWELVGNLLLLQSWLPFFDSLSFNSPSWSISVEFYLYLIFFLTINSTKKYLFIIALCILGFASLSLGLLPAVISKGFYGFFLGVFLSVLSKRKIFDRGNEYFWSILEVITLISMVTVISDKEFFENVDLIAPPIFAMLILIFSQEKGVVSILLKTKIFKVLGKMSYSIYLVHYIVIYAMLSFILVASKAFDLQLTTMIEGNRTINTGSIMYDNMYIFLVLVLTIGFSRFTYCNIEMKFLKPRFEKLAKTI